MARPLDRLQAASDGITRTVTSADRVDRFTLATKDIDRLSSKLLDEHQGDSSMLKGGWSVIDRKGDRKYLTIAEVDRFIHASSSMDTGIYSFCWFLAATGCRISEALAMNGQNIDFQNGTAIIRSLKKRGWRIFRSVPLPSDLLCCLQEWLDSGALAFERLWPWCRMTGYRRICEVMEKAGIDGPYASPKGLRHAFGVNAVQVGVPLHMVQRWLGHADMKTTAIYADAVGPEERKLAARMWQRSNNEIVMPVRAGVTSPPQSAFCALGPSRVINEASHPTIITNVKFGITESQTALAPP